MAVKYVKENIAVIASFDVDGVIHPHRFKTEDGTVVKIDKVLKVCRAASTKAGGTGIRYTCSIQNKISNLFLEETTWWIEREVI